MSCQAIQATSDNAAILASALTSLTGSQVITQSDYLYQISNGNNSIYQNINPVSLHNSYLAGGAVSTNSINPQQNGDNYTLDPHSVSYNLPYICLAQTLSLPQFANNLPCF